MFCNYCGAQVDTSKPYCANCGRSLSGAPAAAAAVNIGIPPYAGFWKRVGAWILDYIALVIIMMALALPLSLTGKNQQVGHSEVGALMLFLYGVAPWLYFAICESSSMQATLGKAAIGIRVTDLNGERIGFGRAT